MDSSSKTKKEIRSRIIISLLLIFALLFAGSGAIVMTDIGQIFGIGKAIIVYYFKNNMIIILLSLLLLTGAILLNRRERFLRRWLMVTASLIWLLAVLSTKYISPYVLFKTHQYNAEYVNSKDVPRALAEDDIVFALDLNGEQKAYARKQIWQTHIIGGDFGDDKVVFTYCVLTNLPAPYLSELDGEEMDLKVLAQTNNNLLMWDINSGEIIQQINHSCEFSSRQLDPLPVLEMTWAGYKKLFPEGQVFLNEFDTPIERILARIISSEESLEGDEWMFKTANLEDTRLPSREMVIGLKDGKEAVAISKSIIREQRVFNTSVGNQHVVLAYFPEYGSIMAFDREIGGQVHEVMEIDPYGLTAHGIKLERAFVYNSVFWAVWVHYHPDTRIIKNDTSGFKS